MDRGELGQEMLTLCGIWVYRKMSKSGGEHKISFHFLLLVTSSVGINYFHMKVLFGHSSCNCASIRSIRSEETIKS